MAFTTPGTAVAGDVLTAAFWNSDVRDNSLEIYKGQRVYGFQRRTTDYTFYAGSMTLASDMFATPITFTADGTSSYILECAFVYSMSATSTGYISSSFFNSGSVILETSAASSSNATATNLWTVYNKYIWTPSSGSKSINVRGAVGNTATALGDGNISVLSNGGTFYPWMRVTGAGVS
jgi:hypothetical protein